ncbi:MAG: diversity-generating retroelement protein Avd [Cyanobium sp.]
MFKRARYTSPPPSHTASNCELPIIEACLDLIRWFVPLLQRLPRQHKFGLGDRLVSHLYHLLEQLVQARYARAKLPILEPLKGQIVVIQLQIRLLHQFQLIDLQRYEHASRLITAIAKQHSGWLNQQHRQATA